MNKEIEKISDELTELGLKIVSVCRKNEDLHGIKVGYTLQLIGGIIGNEDDMEEFDKFVLYFSAKKIMDDVNPAHLYVASKISKMPQLSSLINSMVGELMGDDELSDNCPDKSTSADKSCGNTENKEEKPPLKKHKPIKPKDVESKIIQNAVQCTICGKIIASIHVHDYVLCGCENQAMVDGGPEYFRHGGMNLKKIKNLSLNDSMPYNKIEKNLLWGTRGVKGDQPLEWKFINKLETDHILAILKNVPKIGGFHKKVMLATLKKRKVKYTETQE